MSAGKEIVGKSFEEVKAIKNQFVKKYTSFPPNEENPINGVGVGLSNYTRGRARFTIRVYTVDDLTPDHFKSLKLPKRTFRRVPVRYETIGEVIAY